MHFHISHKQVVKNNKLYSVTLEETQADESGIELILYFSLGEIIAVSFCQFSSGHHLSHQESFRTIFPPKETKRHIIESNLSTFPPISSGKLVLAIQSYLAAFEHFQSIGLSKEKLSGKLPVTL